jgi:phage terminase small subunit
MKPKQKVGQKTPARPASVPASGAAMPPRKELFALEYLKDLNATQAAIRAGYSPKTARSQGQRLLTNVDIAEAVAKAKEERKERVRVDTDALEREAERIATSDVRKLVRNGMLLKLADIPDELAPAISSIEVVTRSRGEGEIEHVAKIRFWDKPSAIALLFKVRGHGHLNDKNLNLKAS